MKLPTIISLFTLLLLNVARSTNGSVIVKDCDCEHHKGGCAISTPPKEGYKCNCTNSGIYCMGTAEDCYPWENCAAGRSSYCACQLGGGDCGGYTNTDADNIDCFEEDSGNYTNQYLKYPDCDCVLNFEMLGCTITDAAPKDYKCTCTIDEDFGGTICLGWAQGCHMNETCPGGDESYCACKQGGGDCQGYPEFKTDPFGFDCDFSKPQEKKCDCDKHSDWSRGSYSLLNVVYDFSKRVGSHKRPEVIGRKDIPNNSGWFPINIELSQTKPVTFIYSFSQKSGIPLHNGFTFTSISPFELINDSFNIKLNVTYTYGESTTENIKFTKEFTCKGPPYQTTRCEVSITRSDVDIPYTMTLLHNEIQGCKCESHGIWRGVEVHEQKLESFALS